MASVRRAAEALHVNHWSDRVMRGIEELFNKQEHCDLTLRFPSRDIKAHRVVLLSCSPFFSALLKGKASGHKIVEMPPQVDAAAMAAIVSFIYTGRLQCRLDLASLCRTARVLQLTALVSLLESRVTPSNGDGEGGRHCGSDHVSRTSLSPMLKTIKIAPVKRRKVIKERESPPVFADPPASAVRPSRFEYPADLSALCLPSVDHCVDHCAPVLSPLSRAPFTVSGDADNVAGATSSSSSLSSSSSCDVITSCSPHVATNTTVSPPTVHNNDQPVPHKQTAPQLLTCTLCAGVCRLPARDMPVHLEQEHADTTSVPRCLQCARATAVNNNNNSDSDNNSDSTNGQTEPEALVFSSVVDYVRHVEDTHISDGGGGGTCHVCGFAATRWLELLYHRRRRHRLAVPQFVRFPRCERCDFEAASPEHLTVHRQRRHRNSQAPVPPRHQCRRCGERFTSDSQLEGHVRTRHAAASSHRPVDGWTCQLCGMTFSRSYNLKGHLRAVHRVFTSTVDNQRVIPPSSSSSSTPAVATVVGEDPATSVAGSSLLVLADDAAASIKHQQLHQQHQQLCMPAQHLHAATDRTSPHQQQQQQQLALSVGCGFILSDVETAEGGAVATADGSSLIPVQDEHGMVSYIALQPAGAATAPDGTALLEITSLPHAAADTPLLMTSHGGSVHLTDTAIMATVSSSAACEGFISDCVSSLPMPHADMHEQQHETAGPVYALPSVATLTAASAGELSTLEPVKVCYSSAAGDPVDDWSHMIPSVLASTNQSHSRV